MPKDYINDYDVTAGNNTDIGGVNIAEGCPPSSINNAIREEMSHLKGWKNEHDVGADVVSTTALPVNVSGAFHDVTGTVTVTSLAAITNDGSKIKFLQFDAALTLTHHAANLILPGGSNITTAAGDIGVFYMYGSGTWRCVSYVRAADVPIDYSNMPAITVASADAGSAAGPDLTLYRNSATPSAADFLGRLKFDGEDSGGVQTTYASIEAQIDDRTGGAEAGTLLIKTIVNASATTIMDISSGGVLFSTPIQPNANDNAALGASGVGWSDLFLASGGVLNFNSGDVTVTHSSNALAFAGAAGGYSFDDDLVMASGKGIDFSATANSNAGMTSETFDDYEEGVYTATMVCSSSGSYTMNTSYDTLSYTKVGNIVHVQGFIAISGESSPSGALRLNCPTTAASQTELSGRTQSSVIWEAQGSIWAGQTYMTVNAGNAYAAFYYQSDSGGETIIDDGDVDTGFNIMVNFWYTSA